MDRINWLHDTFSPQPWMTEARCLGVDPDLFFPQRGASTREAKQVCAGCPVQTPCLEYALAHNQKGIWGGTSDRERRGITRDRRQHTQANDAEAAA